jgi:Ca2+-binding EF-hand superfamily protein
VFAAADVNGDGCLDQSELAEVLQQLGQPLTQEDVQAVME